MKNYSSILFIVIASMVTLSSCGIVGGIFKAGIWTGVLLVAAVVGLIIYLLSAITKRK